MDDKEPPYVHKGAFIIRRSPLTPALARKRHQVTSLSTATRRATGFRQEVSESSNPCPTHRTEKVSFERPGSE